MKLELSKYKYAVSKTLRSHQAFVVLLLVLVVLLAVFIRINTLNNLPVDQTRINQESSKVKPVRFDEDAIKQIEALKDSNVEDPGTQLPGNRQNPFNE